MKIVLTCGDPYSGYEGVHAVLVSGGLVEAQPSRREGLSVAVFHDQVLKARGFDPMRPEAVVQLDPGRMWGHLAVDLLLGNRGHETWGFADSRLPWLLDFWSQFDPHIRFIFTYGTPAEAAAKRLSEGGVTLAALQQTINSWVAVQSAMLRFYHRHRERCLLVNAAAAIRGPAFFLDEANAHFGLQLKYGAAESAVVLEAPSPLSALMLRSLGLDDSAAQALLAELEAAADLAAGESATPELDLSSALAEYAALVSGLKKLRLESDTGRTALAAAQSALTEQQAKRAEAESALTGLEDKLAAAEKASSAQTAKLTAAQAALTEQQEKNTEQVKEGELLLLQLYQVQEEFENHFLKEQESQLKLAEAESTLTGLKDKLAAAEKASSAQAAKLTAAQSALTAQQAKNTEQAEEGKLLLLQLHQVQEELEFYFLKSQEWEQKSQELQQRADPAPAVPPPTQLMIDLCKEIDGTNWYASESDGRWAGPAQVSSLQVPGLGEGHFELQLDVVDAMTPEIFKGMAVSCNGRPIAVAVTQQRSRKRYPKLIVGRFEMADASANATWNFELRFPRLMSPVERGADDTRHLAIRLRSLRVAAVAAKAAVKPRRRWLPVGRERVAEVGSGANTGSAATLPVTVDLCGNAIQGTNWYSAESDGRWAGPAPLSSLTVPGLGEGHFELQLDVVDAMAPEILKGMTVARNGQPITVEVTKTGYPTLVIGCFDVDGASAAAAWTFELRFPHLVSPLERGSDDDRSLAIRLRSLRVAPVPPKTSSRWRPWRAARRGH